MFSRKKQEGNKDSKFTGAHLPLLLNSYLTLYSLVKETPKSTILLNSLEVWKKEQIKDTPEESLITLIINDIAKSYKPTNSPNSKTVFLEKVQLELNKKGVEQRVIDLILIGVVNGTD